MNTVTQSVLNVVLVCPPSKIAHVVVQLVVIPMQTQCPRERWRSDERLQNQAVNPDMATLTIVSQGDPYMTTESFRDTGLDGGGTKSDRPCHARLGRVGHRVSCPSHISVVADFVVREARDLSPFHTLILP